MDRIVLTAETLENARTYLPIAEKQAIAEAAENNCILRVEVGAKDDNGTYFAAPAMAMENPAKKAMLLTGVLAKWYLQIQFNGEGNEYLPTDEEYDALAGSHLLNQIERLKRDKAIADKCFDLLADYKLLEKMVNATVYSDLQVRNDAVLRLLADMQAKTTPEYFSSVAEQLKDVKDALTDWEEKRGEGNGE